MFDRCCQIMPVFLSVMLILTGCSSSDSDNKPSAHSIQTQPNVAGEVTESEYLSGSQFCEKFRAQIKHEFSRRIDVPLDYDAPEKGTTSIFAWLESAYQPALPTIAFFDGGPGQNIHGMSLIKLSNYNVLHVDQRGVACSAPRTYQIYKDPNFYSSIFVARDFEKAREAFQIPKMTLFGVSYGTIPATIYAHLYPSQVQSVILEGIFGGGHLSYSETLLRARKLNEMLKTLPPGVIDGLSHLVAAGQWPEIHTLPYQFIYSANGYKKFGEVLKTYIKSESNIDLDGLKKRYKEIDVLSPKPPQTPQSVDRNVLNILNCKEMGAYENRSSFVYFDSNTKSYTSYINPQESAARCQKENKVAADMVKSYDAKKFPVIATITYFQGSDDGATMAPGAFYHFQNTPQKLAQFLLLKGSGHNPVFPWMTIEDLSQAGAALSLQDKQAWQNLTLSFVSAGIQGNAVPQTAIDQLNALMSAKASEMEFKWFRVAKEKGVQENIDPVLKNYVSW